MLSVSATEYSGSGWPDKIMFGPGHFLMLAEFKGPKTELRPVQLEMLRRLEKRVPGCVCIVRKHIGCDSGTIIRPKTLAQMVTFDKPAEFLDAMLAYKSALAVERADAE